MLADPDAECYVPAAFQLALGALRAEPLITRGLPHRRGRAVVRTGRRPHRRLRAVRPRQLPGQAPDGLAAGAGRGGREAAPRGPGRRCRLWTRQRHNHDGAGVSGLAVRRLGQPPARGRRRPPVPRRRGQPVPCRCGRPVPCRCNNAVRSDEDSCQLLWTCKRLLLLFLIAMKKEDGTRKSEYGRYGRIISDSSTKNPECEGFEHIIRYEDGIKADFVLASCSVPANYDYTRLEVENRPLVVEGETTKQL